MYHGVVVVSLRLLRTFLSFRPFSPLAEVVLIGLDVWALGEIVSHAGACILHDAKRWGMDVVALAHLKLNMRIWVGWVDADHLEY